MSLDPSLNIIKALLGSLEEHKEKNILMWKNEEEKYNNSMNFAELLTQVDSMANKLSSLGLSEAPRVALWMDNSPAWAISELATLALGGSVAGYYANDTLEDIEYKLEDGQIEVVYCGQAFLGKLREINLEKIGVKKVIVVPNSFGSSLSDLREGELDFSECFDQAGSVAGLAEKANSVSLNTMALLVYTSGTSGKSKGVMLNHGNILAAIMQVKQVVELDEGSRVISYLPNAHIFQTIIDFVCFLGGFSLWFSGKATLKEDLPKINPSIFPAVPKVYKMLAMGINAKVEEMSKGMMSLKSDNFNPQMGGAMIKQAVGFGKTKYFISGAAKLDAELAGLYQAKLGIEILEGYGASETSAIISVTPPGGAKLGYAGVPLPGMNIRIVDESGNDLPKGESGEIIVSGPTIFNGYLNKPEKSAEVLKDGWYHTGDRGSLSEDNYIQVEGRVGNRVKFANGEFYDLEDIGNNLLSKATITGQAAVFGENKDYPVALVTLEEDLLVATKVAQKLGIEFNSPSDLVYNPMIIGAVKQELAALKQVISAKNKLYGIQRFIYMRPFTPENGERTTTQKLKLKHLGVKYKENIESLYRGETNEDNWFSVLEA